MLKSLLKGVSMGTGMGIGQELTGTLIQNFIGQKKSNNAGMVSSDLDIRCSSCGQVNTSDSKFCGECGNSFVTRCILQSGVKCNCGYMNARGQKFCSDCGTRLT
jgi:membrane protease subunit (stomatin/prohibitin family)